MESRINNSKSKGKRQTGKTKNRLQYIFFSTITVQSKSFSTEFISVGGHLLFLFFSEAVVLLSTLFTS